MTLLVATSVAEEGLDIRQCNVVIRFDLAKTVLAYIQSRGRARKPGSDYILMVERYLCLLFSPCQCSPAKKLKCLCFLLVLLLTWYLCWVWLSVAVSTSNLFMIFQMFVYL